VSENKNRLSFGDACRELQISEDELEQLLAAGEIAGIKEGDTIYFKPEAISQFKKNRKTEPTIILPDDELDLLDGVDEINLDDLDLGQDSAAKPAAKPSESAEPKEATVEDGLDLDDLDLSDFALDGDGTGQPARAAGSSASASPASSADDLENVLEGTGLDDTETASGKKSGGQHDTVLNLEGLLDDEADSEATTPVPGKAMGSLELTETSDDLTLEGAVAEDDTILDTDVLDLTEGGEGFELESEGPGDATASTLIRPGGSRVMQMKRVKSNPLWAILLALTAIVLLLPMAVLTTIYYLDKDRPELISKDDTSGWIKDADVVKPQFEAVADGIYDLIFGK
jgi:hypothetical protein